MFICIEISNLIKLVLSVSHFITSFMFGVLKSIVSNFNVIVVYVKSLNLKTCFSTCDVISLNFAATSSVNGAPAFQTFVGCAIQRPIFLTKPYSLQLSQSKSCDELQVYGFLSRLCCHRYAFYRFPATHCTDAHKQKP